MGVEDALVVPLPNWNENPVDGVVAIVGAGAENRGLGVSPKAVAGAAMGVGAGAAGVVATEPNKPTGAIGAVGAAVVVIVAAGASPVVVEVEPRVGPNKLEAGCVLDGKARLGG